MGELLVGGAFEETGEEDVREAAALDPGMEPPELFYVGVYRSGQHHQVVEFTGIHDCYFAGDGGAVGTAHYHTRLMRPVEAEGFVDDGGLGGNGGNGLAFVPEA